MGRFRRRGSSVGIRINAAFQNGDKYSRYGGARLKGLYKAGILKPLTPEQKRPFEDSVLTVVDAQYARETLWHPATKKELAMQNVRLNVTDDNRLIIEIHLDEKGSPSKTGKTQVIATTRGNVQVPDTEPPTFLGLNLYRYPDA